MEWNGMKRNEICTIIVKRVQIEKEHLLTGSCNKKNLQEIENHHNCKVHISKFHYTGRLWHKGHLPQDKDWLHYNTVPLCLLVHCNYSLSCKIKVPEVKIFLLLHLKIHRVKSIASMLLSGNDLSLLCIPMVISICVINWSI